MRIVITTMLCLQFACLDTTKNPDYIPLDQLIVSEQDTALSDQSILDLGQDQTIDLSMDQDIKDQSMDMNTDPIDTGIIDRDGDRRTGADDCDDTNADVYVNAFERCDGVDNNCDGNIDEIYPEKGTMCQAGIGACASDGFYRCKADGNGVECGAMVGRPQQEICNRKDDDCDGTFDEETGVNCDCVPALEVCNQRDDNCNNIVDEGDVCGPMCMASAEVCDMQDNDCDGQIDEDNVCAVQCIPTIELCDGVDNNCNGNIDEGLLNACGVCGALPLEICDNLDNDCDGNTDEGFGGDCRACSLGGANEVCNALDDDCDGSVDEDLSDLCIVEIAEVAADNNNAHLGTQITAADDLNGDGFVDLFASAPGYYIDKLASTLDTTQAGVQGEVWAVDGMTGQRLWRVLGAGAFGYQLVNTDLDGDQISELVVAAPTATVNGVRGLLKVYQRGGQMLGQISSTAEIGLGKSMTVTQRNNRNIIVVGEGTFSSEGTNNLKGRIRGLSFNNQNWSNPANAFVYEGTNSRERLGEKVYVIRDLSGDLLDDLIASIYPLNTQDRYSTLLNGSNGMLFGSALSSDINSNNSYMDSFASVETGFNRFYAFGAPKTAVDEQSNAGYIIIRDSTGSITSRIASNSPDQNDGLGIALDGLNTGNGSYFVLGSVNLGSVVIFDPSTRQLQDTIDGDSSFGYAVSASQQASRDGTYRLFVGEPLYNGRRGRVKIYSIR
jgi:hypothetical protein